MNTWNHLNRQAESVKNMYPPGTRIILLRMGNDPFPVEDNTRGTVRNVDDIGTVHCAFDNGRVLGIVPGEDSFRKLTERELSEEQGSKSSFQDVVTSAEARTKRDSASLSALPEDPSR